MEDRAASGAVPGGFVVGGFDGHGGSPVAEHAARRAVEAVGTALGLGLDDTGLWTRVFAEIDLPRPACGSTATILLVRGQDLSAAWVGDSRALLVRQGDWHVLTPDHRIDRPDERARVLAAGAVFEPPYVVDPRSGNGLMMTRALGDRAMRQVGVVADPETTTATLGPDAVGFVVASDGLWDVVGETEAARAVRDADPERAAEFLVELVVVRGGADNVTVAVGRF